MKLTGDIDVGNLITAGIAFLTYVGTVRIHKTIKENGNGHGTSGYESSSTDDTSPRD